MAHCWDISGKGLTLELLEVIPPGSRGIVSVNYKGLTVEFQARVAHARGMRAGLEFIFASEADRRGMAHFAESLAAAIQGRRTMPLAGPAQIQPSTAMAFGGLWPEAALEGPPPRRFELGTGRQARSCD